jgi:hypothetical protein
MPKNVSVVKLRPSPRRWRIQSVPVFVLGIKIPNVEVGGDYRYMERVDRRGGLVQVGVPPLQGLRPDVDQGSGLEVLFSAL